MRTFALGLTLAVIAGCGVAFAEQAAQPAQGRAAQGRSAQGQPGHGGPGAGPVTKAQAQEMAGRMFERMDANRDGKVDSSDREARRTERRTAMFDKIDANRDGQVSREEFMAFKPGGPKGPDGGMGGHGGGHGMGGHGAGGHEMGGPGGGHGHHMGTGGHGHQMGGHGGGMRGHGRGMGGMMMRMADANSDGAVTRDEFMATFTQHFDRMDANRDGTVTPEERRAAHESMRQHRHDHMGGPGGKGGATPPAPQAN